ncbi:MAG: hypothetical protein M1825_005473 [Sarcosagium campestre]|nr:MAG: hypothetical protein M1825_005473 [Sarcosagium campestre]
MRISFPVSCVSPSLPQILPLILLLSLLTPTPGVCSSSLPRSSLGEDIRLAVPAEHAASLPYSTSATLLGHNTSLTAPLSIHSTFLFPSVQPGIYLASVHSRDLVFSQRAIQIASNAADGSKDDVSEDKARVRAWLVEPGREWDLSPQRATDDVVLDWGRSVRVELDVKARREFYMTREGWIYTATKLTLGGIASLGLVFGMPYMLDKMDPEMRAEFEEQQRNNPLAGIAAGGGTSSLQNFDVAGWMAGKTADSSSAVAETKKEGKGGGKRNKGR